MQYLCLYVCVCLSDYSLFIIIIISYYFLLTYISSTLISLARCIVNSLPSLLLLENLSSFNNCIVKLVLQTQVTLSYIKYKLLS